MVVAKGGVPNGRPCAKRERDSPFAIPLARAFLEQLEDGGADVVLRVEPGKFLVGVEGGLPNEAAVVLMLHAEEGKVEAGEVVVVNAAVDKGGGQSDLADILLDGELGGPEREGSPVVAENGMIGHARVDVVLDAGLLGGIGKRSADRYLVPPMGGIDEGILGALEQVVEKSTVLEAADVNGHIGQLRQLLGDDSIQLFHLRTYLPAQGRGNPDEARRLAAIAVDGDHRPLHAWLDEHWKGGGGDEGAAWGERERQEEDERLWEQ